MPPAYTAEEKQCLKKGWGDEYHFLRDYQLNIYKEEDREEGRRIVQGFVEHDRRTAESSKTQSGRQATSVSQHTAL